MRALRGGGAPRDTAVRELAHEPFGWRPTVQPVTVRRYRCGGCGHVWRQDTTKAAEPRARLSRSGLRWALVALVCQHLTDARDTEALGVSWSTANSAVLTEGRRVLIDDQSQSRPRHHRSGPRVHPRRANHQPPRHRRHGDQPEGRVRPRKHGTFVIRSGIEGARKQIEAIAG